MVHSLFVVHGFCFTLLLIVQYIRYRLFTIIYKEHEANNPMAQTAAKKIF